MGVAKNPSIPDSLVSQFATDERFHVRSGDAENPKAPAGVLAVLADDPHENVRWSVAEYPNMSVSILTAYANDQQQRCGGGGRTEPEYSRGRPNRSSCRALR